MRSKLFILLQRILPQHLLSEFAGKLANARTPAFKSLLIKRFIKKYNIDLSEAKISNADAFASFNEFFTRELHSELRPIAAEKNIITSPVDGTIAAIGSIKEQQLLQAKNFYFQLLQLLGNDKELAQHFENGKFATFYLAPHNYHRVHMPLDGKLIKTIYVPGKLFSVNRITSDLIPNLYSRNERLISIFATEIGHVAIILVGAMIVGSIKNVWMEKATRAREVVTETFTNGIELKKGDELGYFQLGSTVITLFPRDTITWNQHLTTETLIQVGQPIAQIIASKSAS